MGKNRDAQRAAAEAAAKEHEIPSKLKIIREFNHNGIDVINQLISDTEDVMTSEKGDERLYGLVDRFVQARKSLEAAWNNILDLASNGKGDIKVLTMEFYNKLFSGQGINLDALKEVCGDANEFEPRIIGNWEIDVPAFASALYNRIRMIKEAFSRFPQLLNLEEGSQHETASDMVRLKKMRQALLLALHPDTAEGSGDTGLVADQNAVAQEVNGIWARIQKGDKAAEQELINLYNRWIGNK